MARRYAPRFSLPDDPKPRTHCPYHDPPVELERRELGLWCPAGEGYPLFILRQEACPVCRRNLEWDGGCFACHGAASGERADWCFPGQRYDRYDDDGQPIGDGQHWVKTYGAPNRPAINKEDFTTGMAAIQRVFAAKGWWKR